LKEVGTLKAALISVGKPGQAKETQTQNPMSAEEQAKKLK